MTMKGETYCPIIWLHLCHVTHHDGLEGLELRPQPDVDGGMDLGGDSVKRVGHGEEVV